MTYRNAGRKIPGYQTVNQYAQTLDPAKRSLLQTRRLGRALASWCRRLRPNGEPNPSWITHSSTREHAYPTEAWDCVLATEADANSYLAPRSASDANPSLAQLEARVAQLEQAVLGLVGSKVSP
jgi:hypothetical protein